ncbi:carboxymuconolactone decarboxylase family protein [Propylenella binzhouense]|uniref:Gamma-carboxymuconolactone decarboxylase n=1 Tax=Propylenella binzhouense TaxID=2555902 RepID=A0A964WSF1_9HYPH|nr:carboxymuconolactone decarboxylase family protein [Propylenella binzhouense]MYZ46909.1 gamma-carboxymuconolactone decarboxylase [Propylenella binzhouense]
MQPSEPELSAEQLELKRDFVANRGYWNEFWDGMLTLSPDFFRAYLNFSSVPWKTGTLEPKIKELVYIAIDIATTHLYEPGLRVHLRNAMTYGATLEEIMEVYQLASVLGMHTFTMGMPVLVDEFRKAGRSAEFEAPMDERRLALKAEYMRHRGYWHEHWDGLLKSDPDFFAAYVALATVPWKTGRLEPKVKELIHIAIDASTTTLYEPGLRIDIQNALNRGATKDEIMEVYQLVSALGMHTCIMGVPVLLDELKKRG